MAQKLRNKRFGEYEVGDLSWHEGNYHIAKCPNGSYIHIGGIPVEDRKDFTRAGMKGKQLEDALHWYDHRHDREENPIREIRLLPNGVPVFADDDSPVESPTDLVNYFEPGLTLDAAIFALARRKETEKNQAKADATRAAKKEVAAPKKKTAAKKPPPRKTPTARVDAAAGITG